MTSADNGKSYKINPDRIILWGCSAGGQVASEIFLTDNSFASDHVESAVVVGGIGSLTLALDFDESEIRPPLMLITSNKDQAIKPKYSNAKK